jgi:hypothetical protein
VRNDRFERALDHVAREAVQSNATKREDGKHVKEEDAECGKKEHAAR